MSGRPPSRSDEPLVRAGKRLSWLLRHGACAIGLAMDAAGWVDVGDVLAAARLTPAQLDALVRLNDKARYERRDGRIRATQGHSLEGCPVTLEALEASWTPYAPAAPAEAAAVYHGTRLEALPGIARDGILRGERSHVHLARRPDSHVGKRTNVDVLLEIACERLRAAGYELFESPNGVVLARHVPPDCVVAVHARSRRAAACGPDALSAPFRRV